MRIEGEIGKIFFYFTLFAAVPVPHLSNVRFFRILLINFHERPARLTNIVFPYKLNNKKSTEEVPMRAAFTYTFKSSLKNISSRKYIVNQQPPVHIGDRHESDQIIHLTDFKNSMPACSK